MENNIQIGGVYSIGTSDNPIRILLFDNIEVHYDSWWDHKNSWGLQNLKGTASYYRFSFSYFISNSKFIRLDLLDEKEISVHRPDLPLRLCRFQNACWKHSNFNTINDYKNYLLENGIIFEKIEDLNTSSIYLAPYGPKGSRKEAIKIDADNKKYFKGGELLYKANTIQSKYTIDEISGIGIYRLGYKNKIPLYYIGNFYDKAGFIDKN